MKTTAILAAFLVISFYSFGFTEVSDKTQHSVEIDPVVPVVLHGFGAHYMYTPKENGHFVFGATIIAAANMPDFVINTDPLNKNEGWNVHINQGFGLEGEYYFQDARRGFFAGIQLFTQEINITNDNEPSIAKHRTNTGMSVLLAGCKFYLFGNHFYLKPWGGIGHQQVINGAFSDEVIPNTIVGNREYHLQPFSPFATIHIGYTF